MDGELENKIKEIGSVLGIDNMPDNIGDIISAFLSSDGEGAADDSGGNISENSASTESANAGLGNILGNGMDIMRIITGVQAAQHQNENDFKIVFLKNLKPLLGNKKQSKVDKCVKFLCFVKVVEMYGQNS